MKKFTYLKYSQYLSKIFIILRCSYLNLSCGSEEVVDKEDEKEQEIFHPHSQSFNKPNDEKTKNTNDNPLNTNDIDPKKPNSSTPANSNQVTLEKNKTLSGYKNELMMDINLIKPEELKRILKNAKNLGSSNSELEELCKKNLDKCPILEIVKFAREELELDEGWSLELYKYILYKDVGGSHSLKLWQSLFLIEHAKNSWFSNYALFQLYENVLDQAQNLKECLTIIQNAMEKKLGVTLNEQGRTVWNDCFITALFRNILTRVPNKAYKDVLTDAKGFGISPGSLFKLYDSLLPKFKIQRNV